MEDSIIGRSYEKKSMTKLLKSKKSEFLVMYGRRRIGKTYLIREFYKEHIIFKCSGINTPTMEDQLDVFYESLLRSGLPATSAPTSWLEAFRMVKVLVDNTTSKKRKVIFIDEISWLDTQRSKFIHALSHFWNTYCSERRDIILIVCGSVSTWIKEHILDDTGELHNRHTKKIRLLPFSLYETEAFLKYNQVNLSKKDVAELYMLIGGIPYYLEAVEGGRSIPQIMDDLFFGAGAVLRGEYSNLYRALFKNHELHEAIVSALSEKNMGLTRQGILSATKLKSGGTFTNVLLQLELCGFIKKIYPIDKKKEDVLYRLMDEYSIFYHQYIKSGNIKSGQALGHSRSFNIWTGFAFENLCIRHVRHIAKALGISGIDYHEYSFKDKAKTTGSGAQIDLIIDRADNAVNIIEAKFYKDKYALPLSEAQKIRNRVQRYVNKTKTKKTIFKTLITPYGAVKNEHYLSEITNDIVVDKLFVNVAL